MTFIGNKCKSLPLSSFNPFVMCLMRTTWLGRGSRPVGWVWMSLVWAGGVTWRKLPSVLCSCPYWLLIKITWSLKILDNQAESQTSYVRISERLRPKHQYFLKLPWWLWCVAEVKTFALDCRITKGPKHGQRLPLVTSRLWAPFRILHPILTFTLEVVQWENALCCFLNDYWDSGHVV